MRLEPRPSKNFFYRRFEHDLRSFSGSEWAADVASHRVKHRPLFPTRNYLAVDIQPEVFHDLPSGPEQHGVHPIVADVRRLPIRAESVGLVVSTHTLDHVEEQTTAIEELIRIVRPGGALLFNLAVPDPAHAEHLRKLLEASFLDVRSIRYSNPLSRAYDRLFVYREGRWDWRRHTIRSQRLLRLLSLVLGALEYVPILQWMGSNVYYSAREKLPSPRWPLSADAVVDLADSPSVQTR